MTDLRAPLWRVTFWKGKAKLTTVEVNAPNRMFAKWNAKYHAIHMDKWSDIRGFDRVTAVKV